MMCADKWAPFLDEAPKGMLYVYVPDVDATVELARKKGGPRSQRLFSSRRALDQYFRAAAPTVHRIKHVVMYAGAGFKVLEEVEDKFWGDRMARLQDPFGNFFTVCPSFHSSSAPWNSPLSLSCTALRFRC